MPKGAYKLENKNQNQIESFEILITSESTISNDFSESFVDKIEIKNKISNEFIYKTPISFEKRYYFPSTPKKKEICQDEEMTTQGRNLSKLFESL